MRIVHYYPDALGDSGVTVALWAWARAIAAAGHEVLVLHHGPPRRGRAQSGFAAARGAGDVADREIPHRGRGRVTLHPVDLARWLRGADVLILHEGWVTANLVAGAAARGAGVPYVVTPHGVYEAAWRRYLKHPVTVREMFERRLLDRAAAVHVFFGSEIPDIVGLAPRASFIVAPTGYTLPAERWVGGGGYIAWLGRFDPEHKGLDLLVRAVGSLPPEDRPTVELRGYDYKGGLSVVTALVAELGLGRWIHVGGLVAGAEKLAFLQRADGYVHPSRWESHSIAVLENLAHGVPCLVSTAIHIAPELQARQAALLAPPTVEGLAEGLRQLSRDASVGERGRTFVRDRLAWEVVVPDYLSQLHARLGG